MKVDIIIPNYNGSGLIIKNIHQVLDASKNYDGKIIIVDDGSEANDYENLKLNFAQIREKHKKIEVIRHLTNKGFSSAINTGVAYSEADYIVLLNSDVIPKRDFLEKPLAQLEKSPILFGVGCMDESVEGEKIVLRGRGIARWEKGMVLHSRGEITSDDTFWLSGGSCILRKDYFEKIGGFDPLYNPFYWEDIDLSYRAVKSGYFLKFDKSSIVRHFHEEGAIQTYFKNKVNAIAYRNQFIFIWKNITSAKLMTSHIFYLPYHALGALRRSDWGFFKGLFLALKKLPAIMKKRKKQKKLYKFSDVEVIRNIK